MQLIHNARTFKHVFIPMLIGYNKIIGYYFYKSYYTVSVFFFQIYIEINSCQSENYKTIKTT